MLNDLESLKDGEPDKKENTASKVKVIYSFIIHCTHYIFSLANNLQLILAISATFRQITD